jgi:hypothetical protein
VTLADPPTGRHERGRPDYHDPLAGFGGAPPAQSALILRLVLASFGLLVGAAGATLFLILGPIWFGILFAVIALTAVIDIVVVARHKARGEPGRRLAMQPISRLGSLSRQGISIGRRPTRPLRRGMSEARS